MKRSMWVSFLVLAFSMVIGAQGLAIGGKIEDFSLADATGKVQTLDRLEGDKGAVWSSFQHNAPWLRHTINGSTTFRLNIRRKGLTSLGSTQI